MHNYLLTWEWDGERHSAIVEARDEDHARSLTPLAPPDAEVTQGMTREESEEESPGALPPFPTDFPWMTQNHPGFKWNTLTQTWERDE